MSDTPETNKKAFTCGECGPGVDIEFARKLERERDESRKLAESYRDAVMCGGDGYTWEDFPWDNAQEQ